MAFWMIIKSMQFLHSTHCIICHYFFDNHYNNITNINSGSETVVYGTYKWEISNKLILKIGHIIFLIMRSILKTLIQTC